MKKQLFIEDSPFLTRLATSDDLKESMSIKQGKNNTLIVKNVPATILNRGNQNGRIYSTEEMQKAIDAAKQQISTKQLLCQASEHPEGSFVSPTHASHVITNAYIKKNVKLEVEGEKGRWDVLFCDIEVLNTQEGQNLQALLLSGCSVGTSIRGLGDMQGDKVINYEFLGFDVVSNPSSGTFTNMPIYEAKIESVEERKLDEATRYTISTYASNTTHDLEQAVEFQNNAALNAKYGTITNIGTKMDQEVDPKTGVEKIVGEVELETSDDTSDLKTAINAAVRAFTNQDNINVTSVTIEKVDDDDIKDSVENNTSDAIKEDEFNSGDELMDTENPEEILQEDENDIKVQNKTVVTKIDGEEYKKDFSNEEQAKLAAAGVEKGKLDPSVVLPDNQDTDSDELFSEDVSNSDEEELRQAVLDSLEKNDNKMALAFLKALKNSKSNSSQDVSIDNSLDSIEANNQTFATNDEKEIETSNIDNNNIEGLDNIENPVKLDSTIDTAENLYTDPTPASDDLIEPEKQPMSDDVIVELSDISYDIDESSDIAGSQEEYDSMLEALNNLPDKIEIKLNANSCSPDCDPLAMILDKAKEQTGLPIKNAKIFDVKDI